MNSDMNIRLPTKKTEVPYLNFLRDYRHRFGHRFRGYNLVKNAALLWNRLSIEERVLFKQPNIKYDHKSRVFSSDKLSDKKADSELKTTSSNGNEPNKGMKIFESWTSNQSDDVDLICKLRMKKITSCCGHKLKMRQRKPMPRTRPRPNKTNKRTRKQHPKAKPKAKKPAKKPARS
ncbi:uncharacterized protein LOC115632952 [Scaptodrosophila lebanonensis]|uniref:Uncharacterized protein LOC115632952 n=1 Tax=Drosophila lebanonensis TaxID=7225 RepID=A0A6J2UFC1_DROLE|nr:uncharacterized protein LOC115632952 [Scaptodrosophila lebanonensis]